MNYEYASLSGKIRCVCGHTRAGEGPQQGKHLYYRCTGKVSKFPLVATCEEGGINVRIADKLVWEKVSSLMSSPDLLRSQIERWTKERRSKVAVAMVDVKDMERHIAKLEAEEGQYAKAYGAGVFSLDKLKEYITPLRERRAALERQIANAKAQEVQVGDSDMVAEEEITAFAERAAAALKDLSFDAKQAIVRGVIEKAVGTQHELKVYGHIPVATSNHGRLQTIDRHSRPPERGQVDAL